MKTIILTLILTTTIVCYAQAQEAYDTKITGDKLNLEITTGLQGVLSFAQFGINLPQFIPHFLIGFKFRGMSCLTWATYIDENTKDSVSFHPVTISGILSVGGTSDFFLERIRTYGALEILIGHTFTPYDDAFNNSGNLVGDNLTAGIFGIYGVEFFSSKNVSLYIESGGGFKTIKGDKNNQYLLAASWLGSGVTFRMGAKIYIE